MSQVRFSALNRDAALTGILACLASYLSLGGHSLLSSLATLKTADIDWLPLLFFVLTLSVCGILGPILVAILTPDKPEKAERLSWFPVLDVLRFTITIVAIISLLFRPISLEGKSPNLALLFFITAVEALAVVIKVLLVRRAAHKQRDAE